MSNLDCFKAYDIRGRIPDEINESLAYDIGRAYAGLRAAAPRGGRLRHPPLEPGAGRARSSAASTDSGVDVLDIGLCGTEGTLFRDFRRRSSTAASWSPRATIRRTTTA